MKAACSFFFVQEMTVFKKDVKLIYMYRKDHYEKDIYSRYALIIGWV